MKEYQNEIAVWIEEAGLEILGPAKQDSDGFWYPVTDDEYEKLI